MRNRADRLSSEKPRFGSDGQRTCSPQRPIEPSPRQAAGRVLPVTALLRSTVWINIDFQFTRYRGLMIGRLLGKSGQVYILIARLG